MDPGFEVRSAIADGSFAKVKGLVQQGFSPDTILEQSSHLSALTSAVIHGQTKMVKLFIRCKASIDVKDIDGMTAAMYCCVKNNGEILKLLIKAGADMNEADNDEKTVLHHAAHKGSVECLNIVLECNKINNINVLDKDNKTPLACSAFGPISTDCLRILIQQGADLNIRDVNGECALSAAIQIRKVNHALLLLEKGAEINVVNDAGKSPLTKALEQISNDEMIEVVRKLLSYNARPSISRFDELFLHELIVRGWGDIVQQMLINGCSPQLKRCKGAVFRGFNRYITMKISPLAVALLSNELGIAKYLIANSFLTQFDITIFPKNNHIITHLQRNQFNHCLSLIKSLCNSPLPFLVLTRLAVSQIYQQCKRNDYKEFILSILPHTNIKRSVLVYESSSTRLCIQEWGSIPLLNEDCNNGSPVSSNWPIGRDLEICKFPCCHERLGYRVVTDLVNSDDDLNSSLDDLDI